MYFSSIKPTSSLVKKSYLNFLTYNFKIITISLEGKKLGKITYLLTICCLLKVVFLFFVYTYIYK